MSPVLQAFPQRSLKLKLGRGRFASLITGLFGLLFAGGMVAVVAVTQAPTLWTDWQVRDSAVASRDARMVSGSCRSRIYLLQSCRISLAWAAKGRSVQREVEYLFVWPSAGSFAVQARVDPQRPEMLTTDLGLDHLWNRVVTTLAMAAVGLLIGLAMLFAAIRGFRDAGLVDALSGRNLQPVPVQFVAWGPEPSWTVRDEFGNLFTWPVRKTDTPFDLDRERALILALRESPGSPAFPLDDKLRLVQLTSGERARIEAAKASLPQQILMR